MRPPHLILCAHGSADPRFGEIVEQLAETVRVTRPDLEVRVGYLDHGEPIEAVTDEACVVVPLLLTSGFHVRTDIPSRAAGTVTPPIGDDPRLVAVVAERLREAGWTDQQPVVLAATGSADPRAIEDVRRVARDLAAALGVEITPAFLADGEPKLVDVEAAAIASYLLAPGRFQDQAATSGAPIVAAPLGAHPLIGEAILARYDAAVASRDDAG